MQCKFTGNGLAVLQPSDLHDEVEKARRLASRGLADTYILMTNAKVTGTSEENIRAMYGSVPGITHVGIYGGERISQMIRESPRLRMLVPRVYGLGDLSQIMDERAYAQAQEILSALGDDLGKFVITDPYLKSARALVEHGFVLLLGEPACGKSTIAAALSLGALDEWGCSTVKARDADDFVRHWNPNEPKQLFWVDDAFGATQLDWSSIAGWNRVFPHVQAAIRGGAKVLFTSRDYVYQLARGHIKESAFPLLRESQVVIHVEHLTKEEREQILYNHIRLGTQPREYKSSIKPFLPKIAADPSFSPEIARRLGDPMFTRSLVLAEASLRDFVSRPVELLCEIIRSLDAESRSALGLVFMRTGTLASPVVMTNREQEAVIRMGGSFGGTLNALNALKGSLVVLELESGRHVWRFRHPTVRDAFATLVAENVELMDIYLAGARVDQLLREVSCGDVGIQGAKVVVPSDRFETVLTRMEEVDTSVWLERWYLCQFVAYRCSREFLEILLERFPELVQSLRMSSPLSSSPDARVFVRLRQVGLLPNDKWSEVISAVRDLVVATPDSGFLDPQFRDVLTESDLSDLREEVRTSVIPCVDGYIDTERELFTGGDPSWHFDQLKGTLIDYREWFVGYDQEISEIDRALVRIDQVIEVLRSKEADRGDIDEYPDADSPGDGDESRSTFDDVDL